MLTSTIAKISQFRYVHLDLHANSTEVLDCQFEVVQIPNRDRLERGREANAVRTARITGLIQELFRPLRVIPIELLDLLRPLLEKGNKEGRILGDDHFAESALQQAGEPIHQTLELEEIIQAVCQLYRITEKQLIAKGKERKTSEARSVIAWIVRESENLTLEVWGECCGRDGVTLSNAI